MGGERPRLLVLALEGLPQGGFPAGQEWGSTCVRMKMQRVVQEEE